TGDPGSSMQCFCVKQMRNILQQIITKYPTDTLVVSMKSGETATGRAGSLLSGANAGLFQLINAQSEPQEAVSICNIVAVSITSASYKAMDFLSAPSTLNDCGADCNSAIRAYIPIDTNAKIKADGKTVADGKVVANADGMIVTVNENDLNPIFVSTCSIEILKK
ncbi:MAG: collagen-like protein, partial [Oscillospiraceae bacterium]